MKLIRAVIFDMDGVLLDSEPFWKQAECEVFNSVGVPLTYEMCETTTGMRLIDVTKLWHDRYPWDISKEPFEKVNMEIVDLLIELIRQKGKLNDGVKDLFEWFRSKGLPMAVASSSDLRIINAVMNKFDIGGYFKVIHSAEFEDYGKPHPAIYLSTAKKLGVLPNECLAIEDSLNGLRSATAAGMKTIAVPEAKLYSDAGFDDADLKLRSLAELNEERFSELDSTKC